MMDKLHSDIHAANEALRLERERDEARETIREAHRMLDGWNVPRTAERDEGGGIVHVTEYSLPARLSMLLQDFLVPGEYVCPECGYRQHSRVLRASDGAVGIAAEPSVEFCPNDEAQLRQQTWREACAESDAAVQRRRFLLRDLVQVCFVQWALLPGSNGATTRSTRGGAARRSVRCAITATQ